MYTINDAEIKTAIRASTAFQDFNITKIKVAGIMVYEECANSTRYQVAIQHKVLEDGDNASVYEVAKRADGTAYAYFNGTFRVAKDGSLDSCYKVEYGGFTNQTARDWLSAVFTGPAEEVPSEQIEEPAEELVMNDFMKQELRLNGERMADSQQKVVCAMGLLDESQTLLHDMMRSYHFDGVPEDFEEKVKDFNARMTEIHNQMIHLCDDMREASAQARSEVDE